MSDEYLFEKAGNDVEIERLEGLLSTYRIEPIVPRLARTEVATTPTVRMSWFRLGYALAFASLVIVLGGTLVAVRYLGRVNREVVAVSPAETPEIDRSFVAPATGDRASADEPVTATEPPAEIKRAKTYVAVTARHVKRPVENNVATTKTPKLTKEEQYAYDQLKVALWITGTKLKVVQDTINRVDDAKTDRANDRR